MTSYCNNGELYQTFTADTMADGSPCIYTAVNAKSTTEIVLECSQADARRLCAFSALAEFSFTGLNIISNSNLSDTVHCYLMGAVQVELVSEKADICQVRIPVQLVNLS
jgi:hypothetical protein